MSIARLCDHSVTLYRATVTRDGFGDTIEAWVPQDGPTGLNARPNQNWSGDLQDAGPGEEQNARRQWFLLPEFDVQERDVMSVTAGPESGALLRIVSVTRTTARRTPHHYEVNVEPFTGELS